MSVAGQHAPREHAQDGETEASGAMASANTASQPSAVASSSKLMLDREKKRFSLRTANMSVWQDGAKALKGPFDSNMKKNTAYIKRIRQTLGAETKDQLIKESTTLNLDKYIEEIVQAIPEGLGKCTTAKDCLTAAETLSALHARFDPAIFALPLSAMLTSHLAVPNRATLQALPQDQREKDEVARVQRQKVLLRASAELALVEIVRHDKGKAKADPATESTESPGQEWLYLTLREFLANDREHTNVPILLNLLKALGPSLVGISKQAQSKDIDTSSTADRLAALSLENDERVVDTDMQARFRKMCETYFATLGKRIVKEHSRLQEQDKRNHEAYIRSGEIFEDRQQNYEKMMRSFDRLHEWGKLLSDYLSIPLPALSTESKSSGIGLAVNLDARSGLGGDSQETEFASGKSVWEDEDTRRFYVDLVDLSEMVPPTLLQSGLSANKKAEEEKTSEGVATNPQGADENVSSPKVSHVTDQKSDVLATSAEEKETELAAGPAAQLNAFLAGLTELSSRSLIDSAAVDFAFLNTKVARKRLVKQLVAIPRNRSDLIPYYARLIATLSKYMPDVGQGVVANLDDEFRLLQKKRNVDLTETRAKNMRFIGELVKFGITPMITIEHCFRVCFDDFNGPNVENVATLLETCGRFLLRTEETSERMQKKLEVLRRKRATQNLDARQLVLLDNAYYQCNPPEREVVQMKQRTPAELYISHLIYDVLQRGTQDKVLKQLRKLQWNDAVTREALQNAFSRSWRIKFSNLHLLAVLLHDSQPFHAEFAVHVVDAVCEQIRRGMETNIFKHNQRRVATLKYLGELYNYRLVNSDMIFEQLWSLISFGHPEGRALPGQVSPIDAPDDYFRLRLVCTLLDACGVCFDRGALRKRLDDYLLILNVYVLSKEQPLPIDVDFMLTDTLEALRPTWKMKQTFEEAAAAADAMLEAQRAEVAKKEAAQAAIAAAAGGVQQVAQGAEQVKEMDILVDGENESADEGDNSDSASSLSDEEAPRHISKDDASTDSESTSDEGSDDSESNSGEDDDNAAAEEEDDAHARRDVRSQDDQDAEDDFLRDLQKMMAEGNASTPQQGGAGRSQRGLFDIGLPFIKKAQAQQSGATLASRGSGNDDNRKGDEGAAATPPLPAQHMRFSLLSKRGNRQQTHEVHVPMDAAIAVHSRANEEQQLAERQQMKRLVLGMETREQTSANDPHRSHARR